MSSFITEEYLHTQTKKEPQTTNIILTQYYKSLDIMMCYLFKNYPR